ncbi:pentapeptide repeat-containing protein [Longispora sp. NPDC051575]|uniref:pentapeptide repeat-containing protein n=1 Tax=Longispora sp. NPDC051575 TaxID=3154943 RepID=UPI0034129577
MSGNEGTVRDEVERLRAMPMRRAVTIAVTSGFVGMVVVVAGLWWLAGTPSVHRGGTLSAGTVIGVLQLVFGLVVLPAGVVALVVNYRKQRVSEAAHGLAEIAERRSQAAHQFVSAAASRDDVSHFEERYARGAELLGHASPAVRLAGVNWLAALADSWPQGRQRCADLLCGYARLPYDPQAGTEGLAERSVRIEILGLISRRMYVNAAHPWHDLDINLRDVLFSGRLRLNGWHIAGSVSFDGATFGQGSKAYFSDLTFGERGELSFIEARIDSAEVRIHDTTIGDQQIRFSKARVVNDGKIVLHTCPVSGELAFQGLELDGGNLELIRVTTSPGTRIDLSEAHVVSDSDSQFYFLNVDLDGCTLNFHRARLEGATVDFPWSRLAGATVSFEEAHLAAGTRVSFPRGSLSSQDGQPPRLELIRARFGAGSRIEIEGQELSCRIRLSGARFEGGDVDLSKATFSDAASIIGLPADLPASVTMPATWPRT